MEFLYVIRPSRPSMPVEGPTEEEAVALSKHGDYLEALAKSGVVLLAGRTQNQDETTFGLVVFHADDEDAARKIMMDDPGVAHGVMTATLYPYRIAYRSE